MGKFKKVFTAMK